MIYKEANELHQGIKEVIAKPKLKKGPVIKSTDIINQIPMEFVGKEQRKNEVGKVLESTW